MQGEKGRQTIDSERKVRKDKKHPVLPKLDHDTHRKLKRLAFACQISKTKLAAELIELCVNHADVVKWFQEQYNADDYHRLIIVRNMDGSIDY